jgi:hypothetical protein
MARRIKDLAGQTDLLGILEPAHQGRIAELEAENYDLLTRILQAHQATAALRVQKEEAWARVREAEAANAELTEQLLAYTVTECESCGGEIGPANPCICTNLDGGTTDQPQDEGDHGQ